MLRSDRIIKDINDILTYHVVSTANLARSNLNDQAVLSEGMCAELGSALLGCSLKSVNGQRSNNVAVDLGDLERRVSVQVTIRTDRSKIQQTIDAFVGAKLYEHYDALYFIILAPGVQYNKEFETHGKITFKIAEHVMPLSALISRCASLDIDTKARILDICKKYIALPTFSDSSSPADWLEKANVASIKCSTSLYNAVVPDYLGRRGMNPVAYYKISSDSLDDLKRLIDARPLAVPKSAKDAVTHYYALAMSVADKVRIFVQNFDPKNMDQRRRAEWYDADQAQRGLGEAVGKLEERLAEALTCT